MKIIYICANNSDSERMANQWVGYFGRTYETIKSEVLTRLRIEAPEITDFNSSNILIKIVEIYAGIADMIHYYIDKLAQETFLLVCRKFVSAILFAKAYNYRVKGAVASYSSIKFFLNKPATTNITIPQGFKISTTAGLIFETLQSGTIANTQSLVFIPAIQRTKVVRPSSPSTGLAKQIIELTEKVVDGSIVVKVNGINYFPQETFAFSTASDLHFVPSINLNAKMEVTFGDNLNGVIPAAGATIDIEYYETEGIDGNVSALSINTLVDRVSLPDNTFTLSCENLENASGGTNAEGLEDLRRRIPLFIRTLERAVTLKDFQNLTELAAGVEKAGVIHACGAPLEIFIAPQSGGIAPPNLISATSDFIDKRKTINVNHIVKTIGEVRLKYNLNVEVIANFSNATVKAQVLQALLLFHSVKNQQVSGKIKLSDLYDTIESVTGVQSSEINSIKILPYGRTLIGTNTLNWNREVQDASTTTQRWRIKFTSDTQFELYKGNTLESTGNTVNTTITKTEIIFSVLGTYTTGNEFEFYTYPAMLSLKAAIQLTEPSLLASYESDITIIATGGL